MTTTATTARKFAKGDRVVVDPNGIGVAPNVLGRVFVVDRVNPVNVVCKPEDGVGRGINYPKYLLLPATEEGLATALGLGTTAAPGVAYVPPVWHDNGMIVTCDADLKFAGGVWPKGSPLVVVKCDGRKTNVTNLGGNTRGTYFRVPVARLTVRDTAWLTEYLVDAS